MKEAVHPLFCDITWGAGGSTSDLSMALAGYMQNDCSLRANLHLTCTNNSAAQIEISLKQALDQGVCNLVALRGDPPAGQDHWQSTDEGFQCALDLVKFIREKFPHDAFGISVAGYPEGHPLAITKVDDPDIMTETERARCSTEFDENGSKTYYTCRDEAYASELAYLKQKVDAGAGAYPVYW